MNVECLNKHVYFFSSILFSCVKISIIFFKKNETNFKLACLIVVRLEKLEFKQGGNNE